MLIYRIVP